MHGTSEPRIRPAQRVQRVSVVLEGPELAGTQSEQVGGRKGRLKVEWSDVKR